MKKTISLGSLVVLLLMTGIWMQYLAKEKGKQQFKDFFSSEINSQVGSVGIAYKGTALKLIDGREFIFYPITDKSLNDNKIFRLTAQRGDTVIKKRESDTLYLVQAGKKRAYTFEKY